MEEWKSVDGTNGFIEVSNLGRVRSLLRGEPKILKAQTDNKGYKRVSVTINRVKKHFKVHRIVASAFIENPNALPQVNHIDGDKSNNEISNLEWVTNRQNVVHAFAMMSGEVGVSAHNVKFKPKTMKVNGKKVYLQKRSYGYSDGQYCGLSNENGFRERYVKGMRPVVGTNGKDVMHFESVGAAERNLGSRHVSAVLTGKRTHTKGWKFAYEEGGDSNDNPGDRQTKFQTGDISA